MPGAFGAIGAYAIAAHPDEAPPQRLPLITRLQRGDEVETVALVEIINRPVAPVTALPAGSDAIAALAIGDAPDLLSGAGADERLFIGDGAWCGRPDDFGAAHLEAAIRIADIGEWQEEIPYLPEQDRRQTTTAAVMRLINTDGALDGFFGQRTVDGQRVRAWLTDDNNGYSADWVEMFDALTESLDPALDEATLTPINVSQLLEVPALTSTYQGNGGATGDVRLAGKFVPMAFGDCFNVEPDTESFADAIDRWHVGALIDVTAMRDKGSPLLWDGVDHPDYSALKNAVVAPGFFTKALAIGRTKRGAQALGRVTGDIRAPLDTTAAILLALARGTALLPEDLIEASSFGALPTAKVDLFIKGDRSVSVAEIFDALLRPFNGWYGGMGSRRLQVGVAAPPELLAPAWEVESHEVEQQSLSSRRFDQPVRWRVGVTGVRNWTPLSPAELVDFTENPGLDRAMWERLQRAEETAEASDAGLRNRHRGAIDSIETFGATRGFFTHKADAQAAADTLFAFLSRPMRRVEFTTGLNEINTRPGQAGFLKLEDRLDLAGGRPALVTRRIIKGTRQMAFSTLVVTDGVAA